MTRTNRYPPRGKADFRTPSPRPRPANVNRPPVRPPLPANDNWALPPRPGTLPKVYPGGLQRYARLLRVLRPAGRLLPGIGWALLAWDAYELWRLYRAATVSPAEWTSYVFCRNPPAGWPIDMYDYVRFDICSSYAPLPDPPDQVWGTLQKWFRIGYTHTPVGTPLRWTVTEQWYFPNAPTSPPVYIPAIDIPLEPVRPDFDLPWLPWVDPMQNPVFAPEPHPNPGPMYRPRPEPDLPEASKRGYGEAPKAETEPRLHARRAPARTKERKIKVNNSALRRFLGGVLSNYSEAMDFMEAMHDALPKEYQATKPGQKAMLEALYRNLDKVNMADAVMNYLDNDQRDRIWGRSFGRMNKAFESYGLELPSLRL